ncbi:hypothetical protein BDP81DRAFT_435017 [Colletotrichum phormii]|uniref:Uncharacterized protein n=1 Tax=Colletotrichum phormii TaxID=359342 RepID=A0AAI9ZJ74_9PEZI|nr:uncharacterized protein BDP81DRAFT_435017 [Colletotrichum phormii]KAK1625594.1 hypothetical protein BDP81DRAFT_435017 [Colletotrichum phormii]
MPLSPKSRAAGRKLTGRSMLTSSAQLGRAMPSKMWQAASYPRFTQSHPQCFDPSIFLPTMPYGVESMGSSLVRCRSQHLSIYGYAALYLPTTSSVESALGAFRFYSLYPPPPPCPFLAILGLALTSPMPIPRTNLDDGSFFRESRKSHTTQDSSQVRMDPHTTR